MDNLSATRVERQRCIELVGKVLYNPTQANLRALVVAMHGGHDDFEPPDGTEPNSEPAAQQAPEQDVAAPFPAEDAELDEEALDESDADGAEMAEQCAES